MVCSKCQEKLLASTVSKQPASTESDNEVNPSEETSNPLALNSLPSSIQNRILGFLQNNQDLQNVQTVFYDKPVEKSGKVGKRVPRKTGKKGPFKGLSVNNKCKMCHLTLHQPGLFCQSCIYKHTLCAMCGAKMRSPDGSELISKMFGNGLKL